MDKIQFFPLEDETSESNDKVRFFSEDGNIEETPEEKKANILETLKHFGLGAAQGASFGFADEAEAALRSAVSDEDYSNLISKIRERYKKASEESPMAYAAGELGGGIGVGLATAPLTGGAGMASLGLKEGIKAAAKTGAKYGALAGLGYSEDSLMENPLEVGKDVASGAAMGAATGAVLDTAFKGAGKLLKTGEEFLENQAKDTALGRQIQGAFNLGKETNKPLISESTLAETTAGLKTKKVNEIANNLLSVDKKLGKMVDDAVQKATEDGVKVRVDINEIGDRFKKIIKVSDDLFMDDKTKSLLSNIVKGIDRDLTPIDVKFLIGELDKSISRLSKDTSQKSLLFRELLTDFRQALNDKLTTSSPEIEAANLRFFDFRRLIPEMLISTTEKSGSVPSEIHFGSLANKEQVLRKSLGKVLSGAYGTGKSSLKSKEAFGQLVKNIKDLEADEVISKILPKDIIPKISDAAEKVSAIETTVGIDPQLGIQKTLMGTITGTGRNTLLSLANFLGRHSPGETGSMNKIFTAPDNILAAISNKLTKSSNEKIRNYGEALAKAMEDKNLNKKNAILFTLLQNPNYREYLKELLTLLQNPNYEDYLTDTGKET